MFYALLIILANGPISKWDDREPDLNYSTLAYIFDVERCLIDMPGRVVSTAYRQPDRPDQVTLIYPGSNGLSTGRIDLTKIEGGTKVVSWSMPDKKVLACAPK